MLSIIPTEARITMKVHALERVFLFLILFMANQKKIDIVKELKEKAERAKSLIFTDYKGLTVIQTQALKKALKKENGEFVVAKNTLLLRSLNEAGYPEVDAKIFEGPTAALFSYDDEISPLKALVAFAKNAGLPTIKAGIVEKIILAKEKIEELAKLPGKKILQAQVVGTLASPLYGLVTVLQGNIRKLVYTLQAIKNIN